MRRPVILHAYKVYRPDIEGGIPAVIQALAKGLREFDHRLLVATLRGRGRRDNVDGLDVTRVGSLGTVLSLPIAPTYPFELRRQAASASLLAFHSPFPLVDLAVPFLRKDIGLVVHWHSEIVRQRALMPLIAPFLEHTLRRADRIVVSHPDMVQGSRLLGPHANKVVEVPYGVDTSSFAELSQMDESAIEALRSRHPTLFVFVGRLVGYKGVDVLIRAMASTDGHLAIIGDGADRADLEELAMRNGLAGRVEFLGVQPEGIVKHYLHACTAFVLPSVSVAETFGIAQVEAMACGAPVINTHLATAVPWVARNGFEALTVAAGDGEALAQAMRHLASNPALARTMGATGRRRAEGLFSSLAYASRMSKIYAEVIRSRA